MTGSTKQPRRASSYDCERLPLLTPPASAAVQPTNNMSPGRGSRPPWTGSGSTATATTTTTSSTTQFQRRQVYVAREKVYPLGDSCPSQGKPPLLPPVVVQQLHRKYEQKYTAVYGTMAVRPEHVSDERTNQSDTDSDSEGSTASAGQPAQGGAIVQSILRVSSCRSLKKKKSSVEFALDIDDVDEEVNKGHCEMDGKKSQQGCLATRCMPRRLTLEEKVALYQIRPDLEIVPMPFIMKELEEMRRRRQRKLMFSVLGGTLLLFMVIVLYYLLVQE